MEKFLSLQMDQTIRVKSLNHSYRQVGVVNSW